MYNAIPQESESMQSRNHDTSWYYDFSKPIDQDSNRSQNTQLEICLKEANIKKATLEFEEVGRQPIQVYDNRRKDYCCLCSCVMNNGCSVLLRSDVENCYSNKIKYRGIELSGRQ
ncbi:hypothetical protein P5673_019295 [Acropora cervicornis]|uniref:Uncharacterized protein n=1 Tax=Acropora cervicornis TaxID=6130 RepID=A0AAD9QBI6_ACRCE|nr:hypothetical protein P5673_019295 [Acropora cervicornis]